MWIKPKFPLKLLTFTKKIFNGKLPFFVQCTGLTSHTSEHYYTLVLLSLRSIYSLKIYSFFLKNKLISLL